MSALVLSIADRQPQDVQRRAVAAVSLQQQRLQEHVKLVRHVGLPCDVDPGVVAYPSLDAWYRARPIPAGRIKARLALSADEKRMYGLPPSAKLVDIRGLGDVLDHWHVAVFPVMSGYVVGVKAPDGGGVGVFWRKSYKASDYAVRLTIEHGLPRRERYA